MGTAHLEQAPRPFHYRTPHRTSSSACLEASTRTARQLPPTGSRLATASDVTMADMVAPRRPRQAWHELLSTLATAALIVIGLCVLIVYPAMFFDSQIELRLWSIEEPAALAILAVASSLGIALALGSVISRVGTRGPEQPMVVNSSSGEGTDGASPYSNMELRGALRALATAVWAAGLAGLVPHSGIVVLQCVSGEAGGLSCSRAPHVDWIHTFTTALSHLYLLLLAWLVAWILLVPVTRIVLPDADLERVTRAIADSLEATDRVVAVRSATGVEHEGPVTRRETVSGLWSVCRGALWPPALLQAGGVAIGVGCLFTWLGFPTNAEVRLGALVLVLSGVFGLATLCGLASSTLARVMAVGRSVTPSLPTVLMLTLIVSVTLAGSALFIEAQGVKAKALVALAGILLPVGLPGLWCLTSCRRSWRRLSTQRAGSDPELQELANLRRMTVGEWSTLVGARHVTRELERDEVLASGQK